MWLIRPIFEHNMRMLSVIKYVYLMQKTQLYVRLLVFIFKGDSMRQRIKFTDERVCKSHLLDSCPHDILSGTVSITFILYILYP